MKHLFIGDIHGKWWKFFNKDFTPKYNINDYDKIVFIGDYWDSFDIPFDMQLKTFNEIINLKKNFSEKFVLLLGNHDVHYVYTGTYYRGKGFQEKYATPIHTMMMDNKELFSYFYITDDFICSHAGVCDEMQTALCAKYGIPIGQWGDIKIGSEVKEMFFYAIQNGGFDAYDGPLWLRPNKLIDSPAFDGHYVQIFGHSYNEGLQIHIDGLCNFFNIDSNQNLETDGDGNFKIIV